MVTWMWAEVYLLRMFEAAWDLPREIIQKIILNLNLHAKMLYRRRLRLPRYHDPTAQWDFGLMDRRSDPYAEAHGVPAKPYFGPGF